MSTVENIQIDRMLANTGPAPLDRRRTYLDPEGGILRAAPGARLADKIRAMAGIMARHAAGDGACTIDHLRAAGFSEAEIGLYRDAASALARRTMGAAA
jgi:hypothetical protein